MRWSLHTRSERGEIVGTRRQSATHSRAAAVPSRGLSFVLLASLIGFLVLAPFLPSSRIGEGVVQAMVTIIILVAAAHERVPRNARFFALLTALWFGASWSTVLLDPPSWVGICSRGLLIVLFVFALRATLRTVFAEQKVSAATLAAAISGYLLIAITWAGIYLEFASIDPSAFMPPLQSQAWVDAVYFSLVTITTVGFGDIVAHHPAIRIWSGLEAVMGNLYIAVLIARLVSDWRDERRAR